jgi:hypothetical protein
MSVLKYGSRSRDGCIEKNGSRRRDVCTEIWKQKEGWLYINMES